MKQTTLPQSALKVIGWICPKNLQEEIEGDLIEKFNRDTKRIGVGRAKIRSLLNSLKYFRPGIVLRSAPSFRLNRIFLKLLEVDSPTINNVVGWMVFGIALLTYGLTLEETASYWDPSEFIATSYKLEVPHPPGAPLFLMLGRLFSFFAFGDVTKVAYAINLMSALASAFTILFLYWSIVLLGRKLFAKNLLRKNQWLVFIAGVVGSLAYAFSDSFWFSAVEAEVYAMSSLFAAFVVWAMLRWEATEDRAAANRWLILIAYAIGLSVGVHLLNLLTLPALALIYYFKTYKGSFLGIAVTLVCGVLLIFLVNDFIVAGLPSIAGYFELFFVNTLGLFFGSGALVFVLLLTAALVILIYYAHRRHKPMVSTFLLAFTFALIGYCSYSLIVIRANENTPINESAPKDVMSFVRYLKREQYGSRPLLFGAYFTAQPIAYRYTDPIFVKGKSTYELSGRKLELEYAPGDETFLPRAWNPDFKEDYKNIIGLGEGQKPTPLQNLKYLFQHQVGAMYVRYFMWNFAGRTSDELGAEWLKPSEWMKKLPPALASNRARNNFFMIPFILGLIGMFYQSTKDFKRSAVIMVLFVMTGIAIVVYLNSPPTEPRERDYIYVGSYYAFAVWIGISVIAIAEAFAAFIKNRKLVLTMASVIGLLAPGLMAWQGWDDHDRSNRFFSIDAAENALNSCGRNGILFTGGDNDTFPLWYAQETENCRTDLRALVLSYCNTDWYIDQTTRKAYQSPPFPYTLGPGDYAQSGPNNYLLYEDFKIKSIDANEYLSLLAKHYAPLRREGHNLLPSKVITIAVDRDAVLAKGIIPKGMEPFIVDKMELTVKGNSLEKSDLLLIDLLATARWERPVYLNPTSLSQINIDLSPYAVQEGNAYRILPVKNPRRDRDYLVDTEKTYDLMIHQFKYRALDDPSVYYTNDYKFSVQNHRSNFNTLAQALIDKGEIGRAVAVLNFSLKKMPGNVIPYDPTVADTVRLLFKAGERKTARDLAEVVGRQSIATASFLISDSRNVSFELRKDMFLLGRMQQSLFENNELEMAQAFSAEYDRLMAQTSMHD
jgi:hypothetical protein